MRLIDANALMETIVAHDYPLVVPHLNSTARGAERSMCVSHNYCPNCGARMDEEEKQ